MNYYWTGKDYPDFNTKVHYIFNMGTLEEILDLIKQEGQDKLKTEFLKSKKGFYYKHSFALASLLLGVKPDPKDYVKAIY